MKSNQNMTRKKRGVLRHMKYIGYANKRTGKTHCNLCNTDYETKAIKGKESIMMHFQYRHPDLYDEAAYYADNPEFPEEF